MMNQPMLLESNHILVTLNLVARSWRLTMRGTDVTLLKLLLIISLKIPGKLSTDSQEILELLVFIDQLDALKTSLTGYIPSKMKEIVN